MNPEELLRLAYAAFNARDIDAALSVMQPDVEWPNSMEGGTVRGHSGIRSYWLRQWGIINPHVELVSIHEEPDGRLAVEVHAVVKNLEGGVLTDWIVYHVYRLEGGLIASMEIREGT